MSVSSKVECQPNQCCIRHFCPHKPSPFEIKTLTTEYEKGDIIFNQGDFVTGLYLLCKGNVWFEKRTKGGKKQILDIVGPGTVFGRSGFGDRQTYVACARTLAESLVLYIDKRELPTLTQDPDTALKIMRDLSEHIHSLHQRLTVTSYGSVRTRLAKLLLTLTEKYGREGKTGIIIDLELSKTDLSHIVGTTRESATSHLLWMEKNGLISYRGKYITILNKETLANL